LGHDALEYFRTDGTDRTVDLVERIGMRLAGSAAKGESSGGDDADERFRAFVWPRLPAVVRLARLLVRNVAEADDLAQETMLKAYKAIDQYQDGTNVEAWLMTILRHARVDRLRSTAKERGNVSLDEIGLDPPTSDGGGGASPSADDDELWQNPESVLEGFSDAHVIDALHKLPEAIRLTLLLVDVRQMNHDDAANVLGVPVGTIKSRASRGRAMLREALLPLARQMHLVR
jgi:RNA polymerase sigma-70 factor (ECF subfamily)